MLRASPKDKAMTTTTRNSKPPQGPQSRKLAEMLRAATPEQIKQASGQKEQALAWANAHPGDPRSAQIKAKLGVP